MAPIQVIDLVSSDDDDQVQQPPAKKLKATPQEIRPSIASGSGRPCHTNVANGVKAESTAKRRQAEAQSANGGDSSVHGDGKHQSATALRRPHPPQDQTSTLRLFKRGLMNGSKSSRELLPARMPSAVSQSNGNASRSDRRSPLGTTGPPVHLETSTSTKPRDGRQGRNLPQPTSLPAWRPPVTIGSARPQSSQGGNFAAVLPLDASLTLDARPRPANTAEHSATYHDQDNGARIESSDHPPFERRKEGLGLKSGGQALVQRTDGDSAAAASAREADPREVTQFHIDGAREHLAEPALASQQLWSDAEAAASKSSHRPKQSPSSRPAAADALQPSEPPLPPAGSKAKRNLRYTDEERTLIVRLKDIDRLPWSEIAKYFPSRSKGSLEVTYVTSIRGKPQYVQAAREMQRPSPPAADHLPSRTRPGITVTRPRHVLPESTTAVTEAVGHQPVLRRRRGGGPSAVDGFISWGDVRSQDWEEESQARAKSTSIDDVMDADPLAHQDHAFPSSTSRILRHRELGNVGSHGWYCRAKGVSDELKNQALTGYSIARHYGPTCGDVTCLAWAPDGIRFAAGSIAVSDERSMQYNGGRNLLVGDSANGLLHELPEHHIPRPTVTDRSNVNARTSMRASQDPRLFQTIAAVGFSADGQYLFSAGSDNMLRRYATDKDILNTRCENAIPHDGSVDMLDLSRLGLLATGCHNSSEGSVQVFRFEDSMSETNIRLSPDRATVPLYPTALRFGIASQHSHFLLAGFSSDFSGDALETAGETALWDVVTGKRIPLSTVTRNVFDLAWNPRPSSASTAFCIASGPGLGRTYSGRRTVLQCYAPSQMGARQVLELDCPALDINDVAFCPYDTQLIAAGATDGKVYVYDARMASKHQGPLHVLKHGDTLNVIDHDRDIEQADTGVRFLSWGATASRLYTGSSDGVVKVWNPYRCTSAALVEEAAQLKSAVMSGSFSPDFTQLLVGEENGRLNLLSTGRDTEDGTLPCARPFTLNESETPDREESPFAAASDMLKRGQVEIRPMGTLPKQQAVQGPAYEGPYYNPSAEELAAAEGACEGAVKEQDDIRSRFALEALGSAENEAMLEADARVEEAQDHLINLKRRQQEYLELKPAAEQMQKHFRDTQKQHMRYEDGIADYCKLDCNYFSPNLDDEKGVPVSNRSEQRIPGTLRSMPRGRVDTAELTCTRLLEYGMAGKCPYCPSKRFELQCRQRRDNIKAGFRGTCGSCSAPVRAGNTAGGSALCERCSFGCLRCSGTAQLIIGPTGKEQTLYCSDCEVSWEVGILGYEVALDTAQRNRSKTEKSGGRRVKVDSELDHYHSRWETNVAMR